MKKPLLYFLPFLAAVGLFETFYLTWKHYAKIIPPCELNTFIDCGAVLTSKYSVIFGIPTAEIGFYFYLALFVSSTITLLGGNTWKKFILVLSTGGVLASAYFTFLQIIIIKAICFYCLGSALTSFLIFLISQIVFEKERKKLFVFGFGFFYRAIIKKVLFLFDPTNVHEAILFLGQLSSLAPFKWLQAYALKYQDKSLKQNIAGITFKNPVGLAAGFDYKANLTKTLSQLGFGFQTVGTITNMAYGGNPPPMLGRLPNSKSLMVNKGFKNSGAKIIAKKIKNFNFDLPVGISIGRTNSPKLTNQKESVKDIIQAFKTFEKAGLKHAYYELNISCPNLIHGKNISFYPPKNLEELLKEIDRLKIKKPVFVKMPINESNEKTLEMLRVISKFSPVGVIFGNLQKDKTDPSFDKKEVEKFKTGNFSGKPTFKRSNELISLAYEKFGERFIIIGCGGIFKVEDAYEKIKRGASLVQLITGMVYEGPQIASQINLGLSDLLEKDGFKNIAEAVGQRSSQQQITQPI